jgi:hypothetical protein
MTIERKKVSYEGDLATPIPKTSDADSFAREWKRRFELLYQVYSIDPADPNADRRLALRLARHHVPGLQFDLNPHPGGRPKKWDEQRLAELAIAVDDLKEKQGASTDKEACGRLMSGKHGSDWGRPPSYRRDQDSWRNHLCNMVSKGRKTLVYKITTKPPGLEKWLLEMFFPLNGPPMEPDENGSYVGALLRTLIT